jgi:type VII secretion protein EccB
MAGQPTTRLHVSGYRFLVRRMEHALLRGDVSMLHDPMRAQSLSLIAGCVLAVVGAAMCAILAFLRPDTPLGDAAVVMSRDTGALYVRVDDTLHPVTNLASARLVAGSAAKPQVVDDARISRAKRGPLLGIPGAPTAIAEALSENESAWTLCDDTTTTVIAGRADELSRQDRQPSVLVTARSESAAATYLLYDGRRAHVDLRNPGVIWALRLDGIEPRPVSRALLEAIPEAPPIVVPRIPDAGLGGAVPGMRVGAVIRVLRPDADDYFVVLADGVQRIGEVAANLIRSLDSQGSREIPSVSPDVVSGLPVVRSLAVSTYPERAGATMGARDTGALCAEWLPAGPTTSLRMIDSMPGSRTTTALAQADGEGPEIDSVSLPLGRSAYVRAASLVGTSGGGPLYLVTDSGVIFGIRDEGTAKVLGLERGPVAAPWPLLSRLPRGPELNRDSALVARDSLGLSPQPTE